MTDTLERRTDEVRKLTPLELDELRSWPADYRPDPASSPVDQERRVDWSDLPGRVQAIFGDASPLPKNAVLTLREEEQF